MHGISLDIGTGGIRAHAVDLPSGKVLSTVITGSHPIPGADASDHLSFCARMGVELAHDIMMKTVNRVISELDVKLGRVERVAVCGNMVQLSIFQNMRVDDLAYAGERPDAARGIVPQSRKARTLMASHIGLNVSDKADLLVPPAADHGPGADMLATLMGSGMLDRKEDCMATDYGADTEMVLKAGGELYAGSAPAGPALEGRRIKNGMLAAPGAISGMDYEFHWRCRVLDGDLSSGEGDLIDIATGSLISKGRMHRRARGITGAGMVAVLAAATDSSIWRKGKLRMRDGRIALQDGIYVTRKDMSDICEAIGMVRAGHSALIEHAGMRSGDLRTMHMAGPAAMYLDAVKARAVGLVPPSCTDIRQIGNMSLRMATDLLRRPELLDTMQDVADSIRTHRVEFATDDVFAKIFDQELAYWVEGMPMEQYNWNLTGMGMQALPEAEGVPTVRRTSERDMPDLGEKGLTVVKETPTELVRRFEGCTGCRRCQRECPASAIKIDREGAVHVNAGRCLGTSCYRCQFVCPEKAYMYEGLRLSETA